MSEFHIPVAAPAKQRSQVISTSECPRARSPGCTFFLKKTLCSVHTITEAKQSNRQGGARAVDLPARSFDLARPGVAPSLFPLSRDQSFQAVDYTGTDNYRRIHVLECRGLVERPKARGGGG